MQLAKVIGTVVATAKNPNLQGQRLLILQPYPFETDEAGHRRPHGDAFVAVDTVSAGRGEWVFYVGSREAANALAEPFTPCDRTIIGIVDDVTMETMPKNKPGGGASSRSAKENRE